MKKTLKNLLISFSFILVLSIVLSLIFTIIRFNSNITNKIVLTINLIFSSLFFLLGAIINGKLNKKRGIINGLIMTSFYLFIILILKMFNINLFFINILIKSTLIIIGNIIGVNI